MIFTGKHLCWSLQASDFIKERLQHRFFPVNIAKFLRTFILNKIFKWLLLLVLSIHHVKLKIAEGCLGLFKLYEGVYKGAFLCCWEKLVLLLFKPSFKLDESVTFIKKDCLNGGKKYLN